MKTSALLITALSLCFCLSTRAQTNNEKTQQTPIKKGYYGIGNNSSKLTKGETIEGVDTLMTQSASNKGYYAIGKNGRKMKNKTLLRSKQGSGAKKKEI